MHPHVYTLIYINKYTQFPCQKYYFNYCSNINVAILVSDFLTNLLKCYRIFFTFLSQNNKSLLNLLTNPIQEEKVDTISC